MAYRKSGTRELGPRTPRWNPGPGTPQVGPRTQDSTGETRDPGFQKFQVGR